MIAWLRRRLGILSPSEALMEAAEDAAKACSDAYNAAAARPPLTIEEFVEKWHDSDLLRWARRVRDLHFPDDD